MASKLGEIRQDTRNDTLKSPKIPHHETSQTDTSPVHLSGQVLDNKNGSGMPSCESSPKSQQNTPNGVDTIEKGIEAFTSTNLPTLSVEAPASSSAFPSPSSSFVPPPTVDEREFAIQPAPPRKLSESAGADTPTPIVLPPPETVNQSSMFDNIAPKPNLFNASDPSSSLDVSATPRRPNESRTPRLSAANLQPMAPVFSLPTSSRPAPQSPVASRRTSRAISVHSSPSNATSSPRLKPQNTGRDSFQARPSRMSSLSVSTLPPGTKVSIKIIDFAFDVEDKRRLGFGEHVPKCNRPARMNRRLTLSDQNSGAETETEEEDGDEEFEGDGWGGFSFGRLSYSFPSSIPGVNDEPAPSQGQLDANFGQDSDDDEYHSAEDNAQGDELYEGELLPLYPGLYRALYAFEPEGTSEMGLEPEQLVRVLGRGGGDGWAIALREDGQHALVPEDYLEAVRLDGEDEDC